MRVDDLGRPVGVLRVHLRCHEHRAVAERARVEDGRDLADNPLVEQVTDARKRVVLGCSRELCHMGVGPRVQRKLPLHEVHDPLVELVERDRRAVLARAQLRPRAYCASHRAASFAW
jgi:hypothetical protein